MNQASNDDKIMESDTSETCPLSVPPFPSRQSSSVHTYFIPFIYSFIHTLSSSTLRSHVPLLFSIQNHEKMCLGREDDDGLVSLEGEICLDMDGMGWNGMEWMVMVRGVKGRRGYGS